MNVGQLITLAQRRAGVENEGVGGKGRIAEELTLAMREILSEVGLKERMRHTDYLDLALTGNETPVPAVASFLVHVQDRTGLDATREGRGLSRLDYLDAEVAPRIGWWTLGAPPSQRIGVRGFDWQGVVLRLHYDIDVETLSATTLQQVPLGIPPLHHEAVALVAAMRLQAERNGEASRALQEEAVRKKYNAVLALRNTPTSLRRI